VIDATSGVLDGPVAPGQLITIYGSGLGPTQPAIGLQRGEALLPVKLDGVVVTFDGMPAPLLVSATQINVTGAIRSNAEPINNHASHHASELQRIGHWFSAVPGRAEAVHQIISRSRSLKEVPREPCSLDWNRRETFDEFSYIQSA
jgi:hypothetical protein